MSDLITVRLGKELKKKVKEFGIDVSEFVRRALKEEVERREREALLRSLAMARKTLSALSDEQIVQAIRSSREN